MAKIRDIQASADHGRVLVDEQLQDLEARLTDLYARTSREAKKDLDSFLDKYYEKDKAKREQLKKGEITDEEYTDWRNRTIFRTEAMTAKVNDLTQQMLHADQTAMAMVKDELPEVYATAYNFGGFRGETYAQAAGFDYTQFTIVNRDAVRILATKDPDLIPWKAEVDEEKDVKWNRQHLQSAIQTGIVKGDSIPTISDRLMPVVNGDRVAAIRTARTAVTGVENKGRKDATDRVREAGIPMVEAWSCTHDTRTRDTHILLDGTLPNEQGMYGEGILLGKLLEYPADPNGDPEEVYNCRCAIVSTIKGIDHSKDDELYAAMMEAEYYDDWMGDKEKGITGVKEQRETKEAEFQKKAEGAAERVEARREARRQIEEMLNNDSSKESGKTKEDGRSILGLEHPQRPRQADYGGYTDEYLEARDKYHKERDEYEQKIEEAKQAALSRTAFETKEELIAWADEQGIKIDPRVLEDVDIRAFNDVKPALEEMLERFPEVKEYIIELEDGTLFKTTFEFGIEDDCLMSATRGLCFSPSKFTDYSNALTYALEAMSEGFLSKGDGTFETLVRHEYGHRVQDFLQTMLRNKYHDADINWRSHYDTFEEMMTAREEYLEKRAAMDRELIELSKLNGVSEYSQTNSLELFAEGFAEYASGGTSEFGIAFGEYLEKWWEICT